MSKFNLGVTVSSGSDYKEGGVYPAMEPWSQPHSKACGVGSPSICFFFFLPCFPNLLFSAVSAKTTPAYVCKSFCCHASSIRPSHVTAVEQ
jgi:hypothetical protein